MKQLSVLLLLCAVTRCFSQDSAQYREAGMKIVPVLWHQSAAEYRALCYQAFNIATLRLEQAVKQKKRRKPLAIVTDLDETIIDNSYSEARLIQDGKSYSDSLWKQWVSRSAATAVPGAVEFLQLAAKKGVEVFYISNRDTASLQATLINLQQLKLPNTDTAHMLFVTNTSSKELRRNRVAGKYDIFMLMGDNLNDFLQVFEKKSTAERFEETDRWREEWGKKFIVLPNSIYGEWENALYQYQRNLTPQQKDAERRKLLKAY